MDRLPTKILRAYEKKLGLNFAAYNEYQDEILNHEDRFPLIIGGERGGKSFITAFVMFCHMDALPEIKKSVFYHVDCTPENCQCKGKKNGHLRFDYTDRMDRPMSPHFVLFGPNYAEPRIEFTFIEEWCRQTGILARVTKPSEGRWQLITKAGVVLQTWSTEIPGSIRAIDLEGAAAVEAGWMVWDAIERIQGRIGAKRGFCIYSGTMENAKRWYVNWGIEGLRPNRFRIVTYKIPSWGNKKEFPEGRQDPEILRWEEFYEPDVFSVRVAAEPVPPRDRVIREAKEWHIKEIKLPMNDDGSYACDFHLAIDPGYLPSAYAALLVASWPKEDGETHWHIFDELYEQEMGNLEVIEVLKRNKYWSMLGSSDLTIDRVAKRHIDGNEPAIDIFKKLTHFKSPYMKYWREPALIERLRMSFSADNVTIDPKCVGLIAELGLGEEVFPDMHPWKYPSTRDGTITSEKPVDAWNHSCKALGYLLLRYLGIAKSTEKRESSNRVTGRNMLTMRGSGNSSSYLRGNI